MTAANGTRRVQEALKRDRIEGDFLPALIPRKGRHISAKTVP